MLVLRGVRVSVGGYPVLRDVSLRLDDGRTTIILGRNGAGKTTTLRTIMGVLASEAGVITLDGKDLGGVPAHERARLGLGYAPEDRRLISEFSVEDNLLLPALALGLSPSRRRERLDFVYTVLPDLQKLRTRSAGHLSGGQGKMVALGRSLIVGTRAVLLDEPFQGLAPALALSYADALARVRRSRPDLALLVTESSPQLVEGIADETLYLERGEIGPAMPAQAFGLPS